jgi:peptide-methionine (S)-S-oxide reductase
MIKRNNPFCSLFWLLLLPFWAQAQVPVQDQPVKRMDQEKPEGDIAGKIDIATFAGGCFWCTEAYFERLKGVLRVVSGYAGGTEKNPTYQAVSSGKTGHAESVQITYDSMQISYPDLLKVFFATHDPTTLNRQGPDVGRQYRSIVFYHNPQQKKETEAYLATLQKSGKYKNRIVTEVQPYKQFWPAETYHQNYYARHPDDPYVVSVAKPKVRKFEKEFSKWLKKTGSK